MANDLDDILLLLKLSDFTQGLDELNQVLDEFESKVVIGTRTYWGENFRTVTDIRIETTIYRKKENFNLPVITTRFFENFSEFEYFIRTKLSKRILGNEHNVIY